MTSLIFFSVIPKIKGILHSAHPRFLITHTLSVCIWFHVICHTSKIALYTLCVVLVAHSFGFYIYSQIEQFAEIFLFVYSPPWRSSGKLAVTLFKAYHSCARVKVTLPYTLGNVAYDTLVRRYNI